MRIPMKPNMSNKQRGVVPKKRFSLSPTAIFCALVLSAPTVVNAGPLDSMMEGIYTNTTDAGKFQSQRMSHYQGGSFYARFPTKSINVAMFDPPRIQSGCGGIDLFGGSFSFISGDEIVQILRAIGQNALGLLFQMGIQAISQPLSTLLSHFSDKLQQMNQALRNSCAAANKLVSIVSDSAQQDKQQTDRSILDTFTGESVDAFNTFKSQTKEGFKKGIWGKLSGWKTAEDQPNDNASIEENAIRKDPLNGNMTWKALTNSKAHQRLSPLLSGAVDERQVKELIINLGGTRINNQSKPEDGSAEPTDCAPAGVAAPCSYKPIEDYETPQLKVSDLIEVNPDKDILVCDDSSVNHDSSSKATNDMLCQKMVYAKLSTRFKGSAYYINKALFGMPESTRLNPEQIKQAITTGKGLIGKGLAVSYTAPTPDELSILENTSIPFLAHLIDLQVDPSTQERALYLVYDTMVTKYAEMIGSNLSAAARGAFIAGNKEVRATKPSTYDQNLRDWDTDLAKIRISPEQEQKLNTTLFTMKAEVSQASRSSAISNRITSAN